MKVNKEHFYKILDVVKLGLSKSKSLEGMLYFQFTGNKILSYNNSTMVSHDFKSDFDCFVHADSLMKVIDKIKNADIDISLDDDKFIIKSKSILLKLNTIKDDEIKERTESILKEVNVCKWYSIPDNFVDCIKTCQFAASKKESEGTLTYLNIKDTEITASDNNRVARAILSKKMKPMMLKADAVSSITSMNALKYDTSKSWIHFKNDTAILSVRRIVGDYPDFSEIFKFKSNDKIKLSKNILTGIDISEIFISEFNSSINILITNGKCEITTKSDAGSMKYRSKIAYKGRDLSFSISPEFLIKMLNHSFEFQYDDDKIGVDSDNFSIVTALFSS